jgi:hypothetical protein
MPRLGRSGRATPARFFSIWNASTSRQPKFIESANTRKEAVVSSLPISMHAGQIFLITKLLIATDLRFYDFEAGVPIHRRRSGSSDLS